MSSFGSAALLTPVISIKETEIDERLQDTYQKLLQAGVDRNETDREAKLKEALAGLKRIFPGVHGRVVDLCKPTANKYESAIMTVLGRNLDAVVVEHEKTAIDCIEVRHRITFPSWNLWLNYGPHSTCEIKELVEQLLSPSIPFMSALFLIN